MMIFSLLLRVYKKSNYLFYSTLLILFSAQAHAAYIERFNIISNGGITFTGNTLGLSKLLNQNNPGSEDSIGAFITTDTTQQVNTYPPGTTLDWHANNSTAVLDLPSGSTVLYAELIWSGSYGFENQITGNEPNTPITLISPEQVSYTIVPDPATSQQAVTPGFTNAGNYVRSANVTSIIQASGPGVYTVGGIPATISPLDNTHNAAGWTLGVVYENPNMFTNNMTLFVGCEQASSDTNNPATVSGFCVPPSGDISGRLFISAIEGDANKMGDHMLFGGNLPLTVAADSIFGSNNPINNFFASQMNTLLPLTIDPSTGKLVAVGSGQLDTRGSFGTMNSNPFTGQIMPGDRQGYDITSIDVSDTLSFNQMIAFALGTTTSDDYTINGLGIQIQVGAPIINATKLVNGAESINANIGDTVTFSFNLANLGTATAFSLVFKDVLEAGLTFVPGSFKFNGVTQPDPDLSIGFSIGDLIINGSASIEFQVTISDAPLSGDTFFNTSSNDYAFQPCMGNLIEVVADTNTISITVSLLPAPNSFAGVINKCKFLNKTDHCLTATWNAAPSQQVLFYRIYYFDDVVAVISADSPLIFKTCLNSKNPEGYAVAAVYPGDIESPHVQLVIIQ